MNRFSVRSRFSLVAAALCIVAAFWLAAAPAGAQLTFVSLNSFTAPNGIYPISDLVEGSDGNFYGTTENGGSSGYGTVFKMTSAGTLTTLYNFSAPNGNFVNGDGAYPFAALVEGSDGNYYGTTSQGGSSGNGTVFKVTSTGTLTTLYNFSAVDDFGDNSDGASPYAALIQSSDGNFYGTTQDGGSNGYGTVFKMTSTGVLTTLVDFDFLTNGYDPSGLVEGSDGNFYGTTQHGGAPNWGTVFKVTPGGVLTTLYSFTNGNDGGLPQADLIEGSDGNFYGTATAGGAHGYGTVFKMTPTGALTTLVNFTFANGSKPYASLVQGSDGNFYGTTYLGGSGSYGTVFKMTPAGALTTISGTLNHPYAGLVQGRDGNFYGTTEYGGVADQGTAYGLFGPPTASSASESTNENTPISFTVAFGDPSGKGIASIAFPTPPAHGTLTVGAITETGTTGTVALTYTPATNYVGADSFTYTVTSSVVGTSSPQTVAVTVHGTVNAPTVTAISPTSGPVGTVVTVTGTHLNGVTAVRFHNANATVFSSNAAGTQLTVTVPTGAGTGTLTVTTPGGSVKSSQTFTVTVPPTVTSFTPTSGPIGTVVTVTGTNLNGVTAVRFHNANATVFSANAGGTQLTVTVPTGAGTGTFTVTTPGGSVKTTGTFTVIPPPTIASFTPTSGPVGTVITITGTNLTGATRVRFHNASAVTYSVNASGTQLTVTVPTGAGTGTITVDTPGGGVTSTATFTVTP